MPIACLEKMSLQKPAPPDTTDAFQASRFVAFGDSGSGLPAQKMVADELLRHYEVEPYPVIVMLGDNLYPNGNAPKYGEDRFTALYKPLIDRGIQFRPTLGNHDVSGPLGVGFPTLWMSNQEGHLRFFRMPGPYYDFTIGELHIFIINTNRFKRTQRHWLNDRLARSDKAWKIVCGHHPIYSSGHHGSNSYLKRRLKPILERHGVTLYLAGHEHDYERFGAINGVHHVVSGGGGAELRGFTHACPNSLVRASQYHFLSIELTSEGLHYRAINEKGENIDETVFSLSQHAASGAGPLAYRLISVS